MEKLIIKEKNLTFSQALNDLKVGGWIKVPEWQGYWFLKGGKIRVMTHDAMEVTTPWLEATVLREDWQLVEINPEWKKLEEEVLLEALTK